MTAIRPPGPCSCSCLPYRPVSGRSHAGRRWQARPDLVMLEPKRYSQPLVPPVLSVFCQVLNFHRSLLLTCTEEPHAELIHPGAADLRLPVRPVAAAGPVSYLKHCAAGSSRCCRMSTRQDRIQEMCAPTPAEPARAPARGSCPRRRTRRSPGACRFPCLEDARTCARHQGRVLAAARTGPQQAVQQVTKRNWSASSTRTCNRYGREGWLTATAISDPAQIRSSGLITPHGRT